MTTEQVPAERVRPGDILVLDVGVLANVTAALHRIQPEGVVLHWQERDGTRSGVLVRANADTVQRVAP